MDGGWPDVAALGRQLIHETRQGNIERVGALLDQGVPVNSRSDDDTPLNLATYYGHRAVAALLVDRRANVNAAGSGGTTPAMWASARGHLDLLQILVSKGANIHHRTYRKESVLLYAALWDRLPICEYLLYLGVDLMAAATIDNQTALANYGDNTNSRAGLSPETKALRCAALEAWWAAGPHPSQVQRRHDERWARRGPLMMVLAEHAYRPLQLRAQAIALAAAELDPAAPIEPVALATSQQRHAYLLGRVFSCEGIVRLLVALL